VSPRGRIPADVVERFRQAGNRVAVERHLGHQVRGRVRVFEPYSRGVATRLHRELVECRREERFTLLVDPANETTARRLYMSWGYEMVARLKPYPDSPVYDALVLPLREHPAFTVKARTALPN
jgi:hypothetical protein